VVYWPNPRELQISRSIDEELFVVCFDRPLSRAFIASHRDQRIYNIVVGLDSMSIPIELNDNLLTVPA